MTADALRPGMKEPMTVEWRDISSAPENVTVMTKIHDVNGCRNEQSLKRRGRLWFFPDGSMYVYYTPTHWHPLEGGSAGRED